MGNEINIKVDGFNWIVFALLWSKEQELNRKYAGLTMTDARLEEIRSEIKSIHGMVKEEYPYYKMEQKGCCIDVTFSKDMPERGKIKMENIND